MPFTRYAASELAMILIKLTDSIQGGELGYALAVSYGAVMDRPEAICVAIIGDGESETGRELPQTFDRRSYSR